MNPTPAPGLSDHARQRLAGLSPAQRQLLLQRLADKKQTRPAHAEALTSWIVAQRRPLLDLIAAGELPRVDAVSITCLKQRHLPDGRSIFDIFGRDRGDLPLVSRIMSTPYGRIATLLLPRTYAEIYLPETCTAQLVTQAQRMAGAIGASIVSLTGLIPSATNFARDIPVVAGLPQVTTGHATTTSAVVLSLKQLLDRTGRELAHEHVCFVGVGSVGRSTLALMLQALPHPRRLSLCDLFSRQEDIEAVMRELRERFDFRGALDFVPSGREIGAEAYEATLFVGATNAPNVVDVARLRPGTLMVDDSDPHCFSGDAARRRMEEAGDVLFSEGGFLQVSEPVRQDVFCPDEGRELVKHRLREEAARNITGCNLSSLLSSRFGLPRTVGAVEPEAARQHLAALMRLQVTAAQPHCSDYYLRADQIESFRARHGGSGGANEFTSWLHRAALPETLRDSTAA